ncbi:MAG TPA: IS1595 family transposase [Rhodospirillaceae bacterium]|nr:IS1595 family transposase [Rhodospirillaceae bacterium]
MSVLNKRYFHSEKAAIAKLESIIWPNGPVCPHCGSKRKIYEIKGKSTRPGLKKCGDCRKQFTVKVGTVFESSHVPLHKWFQAAYLMASSKKGISAHQLHRTLEVTYKTAWFMAHRLREAMIDLNPEPMGGDGEWVQADETYIGKLETPRVRNKYLPPVTKAGRSGPAEKRAVVALISGGKARSFHVHSANAATVREILVTNVRRESDLHTDESRIYTTVGKEFAHHRTVNHGRKEYVGKHGQTTNNVENYFSVFKRGMKGIYQHCREKHLQRYLTEFDFRYNNREVTDFERAEALLRGIIGKRITYQQPA